jgi:hypothetical protein
MYIMTVDLCANMASLFEGGTTFAKLVLVSQEDGHILNFTRRWRT